MIWMGGISREEDGLLFRKVFGMWRREAGRWHDRRRCATSRGVIPVFTSTAANFRMANQLDGVVNTVRAGTSIRHLNGFRPGRKSSFLKQARPVQNDLKWLGTNLLFPNQKAPAIGCHCEAGTNLGALLR